MHYPSRTPYQSIPLQQVAYPVYLEARREKILSASQVCAAATIEDGTTKLLSTTGCGAEDENRTRAVPSLW